MNILRLALIFIINFSYVYVSCAPYDTEKERCEISVMPWMLTTARICPKPSNSSTLINPKIGIQVNFSLWTCDAWNIVCNYIVVNRDLEHGECIYYPGFPTARYCARIAKKSPLPIDPENETVTKYKTDPGYTSGYNINASSKLKEDDLIEYEQYIRSDANQGAREKCLELIDSDNMLADFKQLCDTCPTDNNGPVKDCSIKFKITPIQSKICLYQDPWLVDLPPDPLDYNPVYQPFHSGVNSEAGEIIASLINLVGFSVDSIVSVLFNIFGKDGEDAGKVIVKIIDLVGGGLGDAINFILRPNQFAWPISGGACSNIPLGPQPPPYCPTLSANLDNLMIPIAEEICPTTVASTSRDNDGLITQQVLVMITPSTTYTETIDYTQKPEKSTTTTTETLPGTTKCAYYPTFFKLRVDQ